MIVGDSNLREKILPILAIGLSALTLALSNDLTNVPSIAVSLIGITGGILYFFGHRSSILLLQIWIWAQIPAISKSVSFVDQGITWTIEEPYWVTGQTAKVTVGLTLGGSKGTWHIKANLVPLGLLILLRLLQVSSLIGSSVEIRKLGARANDPSYTGTIVKRVALGKEQHWLLLELTNALIHNNATYSHLLIKPKDDDIYSPNSRRIVSFLLLVPDMTLLDGEAGRKQDFPFLEWGHVSFT